MKVARSFFLLVVMATFVGCPGGGDDSPPPNPTPQSSFPAKVAPVGPPPFQCGAPGAATVTVLQKLNAFWESGVIPCACQADAYAAGCTMNAFVTPTGYGYIFYDRNFLDALDLSSGSKLPADFFMAHEFGHNIQLALGLNPPGKNRELQADCLGGYYVGFQQRSGQVKSAEVVSTFQFACQIGDPFVSPWWATGAHGTCPERVSALQQGVDGYFAGLLPGQACPV
jgi:hypothetical protein